mgnify:CR=1 FL=1
MERIDEVSNKIDNHVDNCALRYEGLDIQMRGVNARLKRIESIGIAVGGFIIALLVHLVLK